MKTGLKNIADSWLQLLVSILIFGIFVAVAHFISPVFADKIGEFGEDFAMSFQSYSIWAAVFGILLTIVMIVIFAFVDNGNKATAWYIALILNIISGIAFFSILLFVNPVVLSDAFVVTMSCVIFLLMYLASYIISTLFMPQRFANPIASKLFL